MTQRRKVEMLLLHYGTPRDLEAREQLAATLPDAEVTEPDDVGVFEIVLDADDEEHALQRVWDAVARRAPMTTSCFCSTRTCPSTGGTEAAGRTAEREASPRTRRGRT